MSRFQDISGVLPSYTSHQDVNSQTELASMSSSRSETISGVLPSHTSNMDVNPQTFQSETELATMSGSGSETFSGALPTHTSHQDVNHKVVRHWSDMTPSPSGDGGSTRPPKISRTDDGPMDTKNVKDDVIPSIIRGLMNLGLETGPPPPYSEDKCGVRKCQFAPREGFCSEHLALYEALKPKIEEILDFAATEFAAVSYAEADAVGENVSPRTGSGPDDVPKCIDDVISDIIVALMVLALDKDLIPSTRSAKCGVDECPFAPKNGFCGYHQVLHARLEPKIREILTFVKRFKVIRDRKTSMPDDQIAAILGKNPEELFVPSSLVDSILERLETELPADYGTEAIATDLLEIAQRYFRLPDDRYLRAADTIRIVEAFRRLSPAGARFPMKSMLLKATLNLHPLIPYQRFFGHSWCYHGDTGPHIHMGDSHENVRNVIARLRNGYVLRRPSMFSCCGMQGGAAADTPSGGGGGGRARSECMVVLATINPGAGGAGRPRAISVSRLDADGVNQLSDLLARLGGSSSRPVGQVGGSAPAPVSAAGTCGDTATNGQASGAGVIDVDGSDDDESDSSYEMDLCEEDDVDSIS